MITIWRCVADVVPRGYPAAFHRTLVAAGRPVAEVAGDLPAVWSIEYSIMLRGASVQGVRCTETSLIGHDVEVTPAPRVSRVHRLVRSDHSKVQISS